MRNVNTASMLDNDLYKFSMSYAYMKLFPEAEGTFEFCDRNKTVYTSEFVQALSLELHKLAERMLLSTERSWCVKHIQYIPEWYWEWLESFYFNPSLIKASLTKEGILNITVTDKLYKVTLYEVPILYTVAELCYKFSGIELSHEQFKEIINKTENKCKIADEAGMFFSEFGTRRRFSYEVQDIVVKICKSCSRCVGTSNVHFAMKYDMKPIGTVAHEWVMFHGAMYGYNEANYMAYKNWVKVYDGNLGIALTDTYTSDVFFKNFSLQHAKLFDGIRQDSGDEKEFVEKALVKYNELGINPLTKTIVFSNALDFPKAATIAEYCKGKIKASFGIGTNLTNDIDGIKPQNIVMKLMQCRMNNKQSWMHCVKISDDKGKVMGNPDEIKTAFYKLGL